MNKQRSRYRFVRRLFYRLKRQFGVPGSIYQITTATSSGVLNDDASSGQTHLVIAGANTTWVGRAITITGGGKSETHTVVTAGFGGVTVDANLINTFHSGDAYSIGPNRITGQIDTANSVVQIDKVIFLPEKTLDKFIFRGRDLAADAYQVGDREIFIDARDLPNGYVIGPEDYVVIGVKRFNMVQIVKYDIDAGWYLVVRWTQGTLPRQILQRVTTSFMSFTQIITGVKV